MSRRGRISLQGIDLAKWLRLQGTEGRKLDTACKLMLGVSKPSDFQIAFLALVLGNTLEPKVRAELVSSVASFVAWRVLSEVGDPIPDSERERLFAATAHLINQLEDGLGKTSH